MSNNQEEIKHSQENIEDFVKKYPKEFNELVDIFRNLKFSDNSSENEEEKTVIEAINKLKNELGLDNKFFEDLLSKFGIKKVLSILKEKIKSLKKKNESIINNKDIDNLFDELDSITKSNPFSSISTSNTDSISTQNIESNKNKNISKSV